MTCKYCGCSNLTSITIPNSVTRIASSVFCGCERLRSITIPNSVTSIGRGTFQGCKRLTSITIPESVTSIGDEAFYDCTYLTSVTILSVSPPVHSWIVFFNHDKTYQGTLHVLPGCKENYKSWESKFYFTIVEDATTGINDISSSATNSADKIFSTSGQRLDKVGKGINIINGKKVLTK